MSTIYHVHVGNDPNPIYIGQTTNIKRRIYQHCYQAYYPLGKQRDSQWEFHLEMKNYKMMDIHFICYDESSCWGLGSYFQTAYQDFISHWDIIGTMTNLDFAELYHILWYTNKGVNLYNKYMGGNNDASYHRKGVKNKDAFTLTGKMRPAEALAIINKDPNMAGDMDAVTQRFASEVLSPKWPEKYAKYLKDINSHLYTYMEKYLSEYGTYDPAVALSWPEYFTKTLVPYMQSSLAQYIGGALSSNIIYNEIPEVTKSKTPITIDGMNIAASNGTLKEHNKSVLGDKILNDFFKPKQDFLNGLLKVLYKQQNGSADVRIIDDGQNGIYYFAWSLSQYMAKIAANLISDEATIWTHSWVPNNTNRKSLYHKLSHTIHQGHKRFSVVFQMKKGKANVVNQVLNGKWLFNGQEPRGGTDADRNYLKENSYNLFGYVAKQYLKKSAKNGKYIERNGNKFLINGEDSLYYYNLPSKTNPNKPIYNDNQLDIIRDFHLTEDATYYRMSHFFQPNEWLSAKLHKYFIKANLDCYADPGCWFQYYKNMIALYRVEHMKLAPMKLSWYPEITAFDEQGNEFLVQNETDGYAFTYEGVDFVYGTANSDFSTISDVSQLTTY